VLVGHSGSGKTTLAEALLMYTGTVARAGRVDDGTTVSDFDEVEIRQKRSVNLALTPFVADGITVRPGTPTSPATCGRGCARRTARCSSWRPPTGWTE
jgi:translation elongation factor EF-G